MPRQTRTSNRATLSTDESALNFYGGVVGSRSYVINGKRSRIQAEHLNITPFDETDASTKTYKTSRAKQASILSSVVIRNNSVAGTRRGKKAPLDLLATKVKGLPAVVAKPVKSEMKMLVNRVRSELYQKNRLIAKQQAEIEKLRVALYKLSKKVGPFIKADKAGYSSKRTMYRHAQAIQSSIQKITNGDPGKIEALVDMICKRFGANGFNASCETVVFQEVGKALAEVIGKLKSLHRGRYAKPASVMLHTAAVIALTANEAQSLNLSKISKIVGIKYKTLVQADMRWKSFIKNTDTELWPTAK